MSADNLESDYQRLYRHMQEDRLAKAMFEGFESVVSTSVGKLKEYKFDLLICIPVKYGSDTANLFDNLSKIELPMKSAVLLGCEKDSTSEWISDLNKKIENLGNKFVVCEPVYVTRARNVEYNDRATRYWIRVIKQIEKKIGMINPGLIFYIKVAREELRLIAKNLSCKYVLWFDADIVLPSEVVQKLIRRVNIADIISGWNLNRHFPKKTDSYTKNPYSLKEAHDKIYYEKQEKIKTLFLEELEKAGIHNNYIVTELASKSGGYSIPPWHLESATEPIEVLWSGFSCVLCTKAVSDEASFVNRFVHAEDYDFCTHAKSLGYRVVVDPKCRCGHLVTES